MVQSGPYNHYSTISLFHMEQCDLSLSSLPYIQLNITVETLGSGHVYYNVDKKSDLDTFETLKPTEEKYQLLFIETKVSEVFNFKFF